MSPLGTGELPVLPAVLDADRGARPAEQAVEASAESFEALYATYFRDVYRYVLLALRRPDDVDDIVADTFDRAFAAWRSGNGPAGRPLPWLIVIARRILVDRWRRARIVQWLPFTNRGAAEPAAGDDSARAEFWLWLDQLAKALPERQREVIFLRYQRDLSDEDIGEILGLSASGVRTLASRALAALRTHPELWS